MRKFCKYCFNFYCKWYFSNQLIKGFFKNSHSFHVCFWKFRRVGLISSKLQAACLTFWLCLGIFLSSCLNILSILFISVLLTWTVFWRAHFLDGF